MTYRYPLIANPESKRLEELKENDYLSLKNSGIVSAISVESENFYGNLVGIASTALSLFDASKITLGTINPQRLSGNYSIGVTTALFLQDAANILSGFISTDRLNGSYNIDVTGTSNNSNNLSNAANITTGVISRSRLTGSYDINITGTASSSTYAETANNAKYADFAVGTAVNVSESTASVVLYPSFVSGIGNTQIKINTNNLTFIPSLGNIGVGTSVPLTSLQINSYGVETGFGTFIAQSSVYTNIDSFNITQTNFKTAEYTVHIGYGTYIQAQKVLLMHNDLNSYSEQYAIMSQPSLIVSIGSTISGNNCILRVLPESGISGIVTYRFVRNTLL
jgi:hypothetical protein